MPPARTTPRGRPPRERARYGLYVALGLAVILLPVVLLSSVYGPQSRQVELDDNLCPVDAAAISGRTVLLLDIGKPLGDDPAGLVGELLRRVTLDMAADAELQVFLVAANPLAPRMLVERLCKPYAGDDLAVSAAKDGSGETRDCDDLPAQLSRHVRNRAARFCGRRDALERRLDGLVAGDPPATVASAYLVEAIDDTRLALAQFADPSLYVFSDMLQHADWYSHAERGPNGWGYDGFVIARGQQTGLLAEPPPDDPDLAVTVYYLPRRGLTEHPRVARAHRRFWHRYFADVGSLTFEEQPVHVAYEVQPFAGPVQDAATAPVAEAGQREAPAAREAGRPPQRPAAEPALPPDDGDAGVPTDGETRADGSATIADIEPGVARDARLADDAPAAASLADAAAEAARPDGDAPPAAADPDLEGVSPQPPSGNPSLADAAAEAERPDGDGLPAAADRDPVGDPPRPPPTPSPADAAPGTEPAQAQEGAASMGDPPGNPGEPPSVNAVADRAVPVAQPAPAVAPEPDAADPPDLAANPETATDPVQRFCPSTLKPEFEGVDAYPLGGSTRGRRANFGSAEIVVAFTIDESGETVDSEVAVQPAGSTVDLPRYTHLFTRRAEQIVKTWAYDFASEDGCVKRQPRVIRLQFRYRR